MPDNKEQNEQNKTSNEQTTQANETAQPTTNGINSQATELPATASQTNDLKIKNAEAMKREIPFAIGLDALPREVIRQNNVANAIAGTTGVGSGLMPSGNGTSTAIDTSWNSINMDGYFNADLGAKQILCWMSVMQSFPVVEADGTITYVSDLTSTGDGAGTDMGGISCTIVNGGRSSYMDTNTPATLCSQYNGGVRNYIIGAGVGLKYVEEWIHKFFPELSWKDGTDKSTNRGPMRTGGFAGRLMSQGCLWAEVVFPISNDKAKVLKIRVVDVGLNYDSPYLDIMGAFCVINSHRDIFKIVAKRNGDNIIDGSKIAFLFQDCNYDYVKGEIVGYGPESVYKKFYPSSNELFKNTTSVFKEDKKFFRYTGGTKGGPKKSNKSKHIPGASQLRVRFFIHPSAKEKAEKIIGQPLPEELMKVNYGEGNNLVSAAVQTIAQKNAAEATSNQAVGAAGGAAPSTGTIRQ